MVLLTNASNLDNSIRSQSVTELIIAHALVAILLAVAALELHCPQTSLFWQERSVQVLHLV